MSKKLCSVRAPTEQGKQGNGEYILVRKNETFAKNTGRFVYTWCKFLNSKSEGDCDFVVRMSMYASQQLIVSVKTISCKKRSQITTIVTEKTCSWTEDFEVTN